MPHPHSLNQFGFLSIVGTHLPRRCGIATFTADLAAAIKQAAPKTQVEVLAISDDEYEYPEAVVAQIASEDRRAYSLAAAILNHSNSDVLSVQHEYGIFGGPCGTYLLDLLRKVERPVVTTLHTVLRHPSKDQKAVLDEIIELSTRLVVMSHTALDLLSEVHVVDLRKVDYIPHGIPEIPRTAGCSLRAELGGKGPILLTFGLLSPDKGIEDVIRALPELSAEHPEAKYLVVGATHPHIKATMGERYRQSLHVLANTLGVSKHVEFVDDFVSIERLVEYLSATDFYITPYHNPMQITSGTLAYSMGAGKVVISTPYEYAKEVLAERRGIIVPFRDPSAIAEAVLTSCSQPDVQTDMGTRAREYGSQMYWKKVGMLYVESMNRAIQEYNPKPVVSTPLAVNKILHDRPSLAHLESLTDDTGILQHATFTIANRSEGYCVDDNARALLFTLLLETRAVLTKSVANLQSRYLSFLADALNERTGRFRNFMNFRREWLEEAGSEDSQGRTMWALGEAINRSRCPERSSFASKLFFSAVQPMTRSRSPRTWAYLILGATACLESRPNSKAARSLLESAASLLHDLFKRNANDEWMWIEPRVAYANARIPQAMIRAGYFLGNEEMYHDGVKSLKWLLARQTNEAGDFSPVGAGGASPCEFGHLQFDQQPIEAASTVSACTTAYKASGEQHFLDDATRCFEWFLGRNELGVSLANSEYGGCYDGLLRDGVNRNQGAESTLSYLTAFEELRVAHEECESTRFLGDTSSDTNTIPLFSFGPAITRS